jgi:hypothetical protein
LFCPAVCRPWTAMATATGLNMAYYVSPCAFSCEVHFGRSTHILMSAAKDRRLYVPFCRCRRLKLGSKRLVMTRSKRLTKKTQLGCQIAHQAPRSKRGGRWCSRADPLFQPPRSRFQWRRCCRTARPHTR